MCELYNELLEKGYEEYTEEALRERCENYLDEYFHFLGVSEYVLSHFVNEDNLRALHREFCESYVDNIKWESNTYGSNRLVEEMTEWEAENEDDFIDKMIEEAVSEGVDYFKNHFGEEEGLNMLISANVLDKDEIINFIIEQDGYEQVLGLDIKEVENHEGEDVYMVES